MGALAFAKGKKNCLLWITAYDKILSNNLSISVGKEELCKEQWLEFHDHFTSGILGVFPLILDLPIRSD